MRVTVTAPIKATEDPDRVREAALRLFPTLHVKLEPGLLVGDANEVQALRQRIWELRIIDTVRGQVLHGAPSGAARETRFRLSKQAALAGKVSFPPTPHPLGDLDVTLTLEETDPWPDLDAFAMWLCPETKDGEIVGPV